MQLRRPRFAFRSTPWPTSRQFYADAGDAENRDTVLGNQSTGEADQDQRQGGQHGHCATFQMVKVVVPRRMFRQILSLIARLRVLPAPASSADWVRHGTQI
jgi:hypothetical protein